MNDEAMKLFTFPFSKQEPEVSAEQLMELDAPADSLHIKRLMVAGKPVWLRRSRFVAREVAWYSWIEMLFLDLLLRASLLGYFLQCSWT